MLGMPPVRGVLGVHAFEQVAPRPVPQADVPDAGRGVIYEAGTLMTCSAKGVSAAGFESSQGFVVQKGSQAVQVVTPSFQTFPGSVRRRDELIANGVLVPDESCYRFAQDFAFTSPSAASDMVLGSVTNGRTVWKDSRGRTLKELQEAESKQG